VNTIVAFMFMGIEGIADEIEMPFGNTSTLGSGSSPTLNV
jgi:predicted membrane chloride channel (bestrophin family)